MHVSSIIRPTGSHMMNVTVIRQVMRNGCINGKLGRTKIAKDKTTD